MPAGTTPTLTAQCGKPYTYGSDGRARAEGTQPISWSLGKGGRNKPDGMTIDDTGLLTWTPDGTATKQRVTLVAENAGGAVEQDFEVAIECAGGGSLQGCGCGSGAGGASALLFALPWLALWLRRRASLRALTEVRELG